MVEEEEVAKITVAVKTQIVDNVPFENLVHLHPKVFFFLKCGRTTVSINCLIASLGCAGLVATFAYSVQGRKVN